MKIVINPTSNRDQETLSLESIDNLHENFSKLLSFKGPLEVKIYAINELINSHQLLKIKIILTKLIFILFAFTQIIEIR
jgi:hypothetical protein